MAEEQDLFWISKKSNFGCGKDALKYGDPVGDKISDERIPKHKKAGEIGSIEMASPEGVKVDAALEKANSELEALKEKVIEYQLAVENVISLLSKDKLKKEDKEALIKSLEALK